jgi:hypothetical protein
MLNFISLSDAELFASAFMSKWGKKKKKRGALYSNADLQMELKDKALLYWVKVICYIEGPTEWNICPQIPFNLLWGSDCYLPWNNVPIL